MHLPNQTDMMRNASLGGISSGLKDLNAKLDQEKAAREKAEKLARRLDILTAIVSVLTLAATVIFGILGLTA